MRIKADESVNYRFVKTLRRMDIKITSIAEDYTSMKDIEIASLSLNPPAVIITEDKDFGELVFKDKIEVIAVVLLRYNQPDILIIQDRLVSLLMNHLLELNNTFTVITFNKTRIRRL